SGSEAPRVLVAGQGIKAGDKLLAGAPDAKLTVVMLDGSRLACPSDPRCAAPLGARAADKPGMAKRMVRAIGSLFSQPERYATTMSRGEELRESVAVMRKGRLDLTDALQALPAATWHVTLQEIDGQGVVIGQSFSVDVDTTAKGLAAMPQV